MVYEQFFVAFWQVEVAFSGVGVKEEDSKSEIANASLKVLPPWMIKEGMNLTKEQRGEVKQESKMGSSSAPLGSSDDKKSTTNKDEEKNLQACKIDCLLHFFPCGSYLRCGPPFSCYRQDFT